MEEDKNKQSADTVASNAERDQDEGEMNNGVIGGSMGVIGSSNENQSENESNSNDSKPENKDVEKNQNNE